MDYHEESRRFLADLLESCETVEHYLDIIWKMRAQEAPASSNGWPYKSSAGLTQKPHLRRIT